MILPFAMLVCFMLVGFYYESASDAGSESRHPHGRNTPARRLLAIGAIASTTMDFRVMLVAGAAVKTIMNVPTVCATVSNTLIFGLARHIKCGSGGAVIERRLLQLERK